MAAHMVPRAFSLADDEPGNQAVAPSEMATGTGIAPIFLRSVVYMGKEHLDLLPLKSSGP